MVEKKQFRITPQLIADHPTHLFVGSPQKLEEATNIALQEMFCPAAGCKNCTTCTQILEKKHHAVQWFLPEKGYTTVQLEPLFHAINFRLDSSNYHVFVLQKAESLNLTCANSLLKVLEEPPQGYHFILHTDRPAQLLPTIKSRSVITTLQDATGSFDHHPLFALFTHLQPNDLTTFVTTLQENPLTEQDSNALLDAILHHWIIKYKQEQTEKKSEVFAPAVVTELEAALIRQPMPGSSKIFWRTLYLNCLQAQQRPI